MKKQFQSLTEKGRWLLATLTLLFTLSIGHTWAADPDYESYDWSSADAMAAGLAGNEDVSISVVTGGSDGNVSGHWYKALNSAIDGSDDNLGTHLSISSASQIDSVEIFFCPNGTKSTNLAWAGWGKNETPAEEVGTNYGTTTSVTSSKSWDNAVWQKIDLSNKEIYTLYISRQGKKLKNNSTIPNFGDNQTVNLLGLRVWLHPSSTPSSDPVDPTITFNNGNYSVGGSALDLSTLFTSNSTGAVTYTVKDANGTGASISGKLFTATTAGTATVTASQAAVSGTYNAKSVDATITVSDFVAITSIALDYDEQHIYVGDVITITPTILPANASNKTLTWSVTDGATITQEGVLTAVAQSDVIVTATAQDGSDVEGSSHIYIDAPSYCVQLTPATSGSNPAVGDTIVMQEGSTGATMVVQNLGSGNISYTSNGIGFNSKGGPTVTVTMNNLMKVGTKIHVQLVAAGDKTRGLTLHTSTGTKINAFTCWVDGVNPASNGLEDTFTYTVEANDGLEGTNEFRLARNNSVYLKSLKVSDCGAELLDLSSAVSVTGKATVTLSATKVAAGGSATATYSNIDAAYDFDEWLINGATIDNKKANPVTITMGTTAATITLKLKAAEVKHTVTYYDGEEVAANKLGDELIVEGNNPTGAELAPKKQGFTFAGWSTTNGGAAVELNTISVAADMSLFAVWTAVDCPTKGTVFSFVMNNDAKPSSDVKAPAKEELTIDGYLTINGSGNVIIGNTTNNTNQYAKVTSTPNINLGGATGYLRLALDCQLATGDVITIAKNNTQIYISDEAGTSGPTGNKYTTASNSENTIVVGANETTAAWVGTRDLYFWYKGGSVNITSVSVNRPYTVSFNLNGQSATAIADQKVIAGGKITEPTAPEVTGQEFGGWYKEAACTNAWNFATDVVNEDVELFAKWTALKSMTLNAGEGTGDDIVSYPTVGEPVAVPTCPATFENTGYEFAGWAYNPTVTVEDGQFTMPDADLTLTAQWALPVAKYTVIFKDGTTELATKQFEVGTNPSDAGVSKTKPINTFAAWQLSGSDIALDDASWTSVAADAEVTLTARWTKIYAQTADLAAEAAGSQTALATFLDGKGYAATVGADGSYDTNASGYLGYKFKNNGDEILFNLQSGKVAELAFMYIETDFKVYVDGELTYTVTNKTTSSTPLVKYLYAAGADKLVRIVNGSANSKTSVINKIVIREPYQVSFDANGGDPVAAQYATPSVTLPSATNGTQNFAGWYTSGDELVGMADAEYTPTADITLVAHWEALSTVNTLSDLKVNGVTVEGFDPEVHTYNIVVPYGTAIADLPKITSATPTNENANVAIYPAAGPEWTDNYGGCYRQSANVTPQDPTAAVGYNDIRITIGPKDGICLAWVDVTGQNAVSLDADKSLYAPSVSAANIKGSSTYGGKTGYKFNSAPGYIAIEGAPFKAGDVVEMFVTTTTADKARVFNANEAVAANVVAEGAANMVQGANKVALTADANNLYLRRGDDFGGWNPYVAYVAVYRISAPILNKVTVAGVEATPDAQNKVAIEVPASTTDAALEAIAYDWISNSAAWDADPANAPVATNAWEWGVENTVTFTDKDGDASEYYITISKAAASSDATLSALTVGGQAIALEEGVYEYNFELPYGTTAAPAVVATPNHIAAVATVDPCTLSGATITVVPESGEADKQVYTLTFTISAWKEVVIWDGSNMTELAESPEAMTGMAWATNGFGSISSYTTTYGEKSYSKYLPSGGAATGRYMTLTVPAGYVAKFYVVMASHSTGNERGMFIGSNLVKDPDATSVLQLSNNTRDEAVAGMSEIVGAGTWYINPNASIDIQEIRAYLRKGMVRNSMLGNGVLGTSCVDHNVAIEDIQGATFYELMGREPVYGKLAFDEIVSGELEAGVPYLFQAHGDKLILFYGETKVDEPQNQGNGMYGTFVAQTLTELDGIYYFAQRALWSCVDLTELSLPANRAYVKLSEIDYLEPEQQNPAPGRRRVLMNVNGEKNATGFENIEASEKPMKLMINGQIFILRGEKMYDATGRLVK